MAMVGVVGVAVVLVEVDGGLVVVTTAVMVVMEQVDSRLDCCARRSSHCRSQSHDPEHGLVVGSVVVVAIGEEVIVGCSCCVVMGVIQKGFYHPKRLLGNLFLAPLLPSKFHGRSFVRTATSSSMNRGTRKMLHGN